MAEKARCFSERARTFLPGDSLKTADAFGQVALVCWVRVRTLAREDQQRLGQQNLIYLGSWLSILEP